MGWQSWNGLVSRASTHTLTSMDIERRLHKFLSCSPRVDPSAYIAEGAIVIGAVTLGPHASVWHNCVLRGDIERIDIGEGSNIQDGTVVHLADDLGVRIGKYVTVGHLAMIHACTIEDECLIGMKATILDGAVIGKRSIVGAGAVVTKNTIVPPGSLVLGMPAKVVKTLTESEQGALREWADKYVKVAEFHKRHFSLLA
jgi:carbonic anhydrase/acetyltransferase-like protein (isoleucine patch superfamily)